MKKLSEIEITEEMKEKASKCTTAEELVTLAQQYDVELPQEEIDEILKSNTVKELDDDDLDQVSGGATHAESVCKYLPNDHGKFIEKYDAEHYIGQKVYVVKDSDREIFAWGTLVKSYDEEIIFGTSKRMHEVTIDGYNDYWRARLSFVLGNTQRFNSSYASLFLMH